jgi:hypothetical protein
MKSENGESQESVTCVNKGRETHETGVSSYAIYGGDATIFNGSFDGRPRQDVLGQLPPQKAPLSHYTMRGVWEVTANIRAEIEGLQTEVNALLTATEFNAALFLEKTKSLQELHDMERVAMEEAIAKLTLTLEEKE